MNAPPSHQTQFWSSQRKVLILAPASPVPLDRRVWHEASALTAKGYQVSVICPSGHGNEKRCETIEGITIYRHSTSLSFFQEFILSCWVLARQGFDVIHASAPADNFFLIGGFFKFMFDKRFLFDPRTLGPEWFEAKSRRRGWGRRIMLLKERLAFNVTDTAIMPNESFRRIAIERGGMTPEKVFIVRTGIDLFRMKIRPPVPALLCGKSYLVACAGIMEKKEDPPFLIEAIRHIVHDLKRLDIHFVLAGNGPALGLLKTLVAEKEISGFVTFIEPASEPELLDVLNTADVCVSPAEANPMNDIMTMDKIIDYMALGKPIVQFDLAEGRFSARGASLYAKANDALDFAAKIIELIDDPNKRAAMGACGRARAERELAWVYEAPKLLAAYNAFTGEG
jgi:glycosyltransferase involved in cell wall biosynthesis